MIKFFRRIRQKKLSENKFSKYIFYAIGEIFLVVFGILIALQINNNNDQRKAKIQLDNYLEKIARNVMDDIKQIKELQIKRDYIWKLAANSANALKKGDFTKIQEFFGAQRIFQEFYFIPDNSGFKAILSSPFIGSIKNTKVDSFLTLYYAQVEECHEDELSYNTFIENMEVQLSISEDFTFNAILYEKVSDDKEFDINSYKAILPYFKNNAFKSAVIRTNDDRSYDRNYKALIELGNLLIEEIDYFTSKK